MRSEEEIREMMDALEELGNLAEELENKIPGLFASQIPTDRARHQQKELRLLAEEASLLKRTSRVIEGVLDDYLMP